jgi:hypothetical protein
MHQNAMKGIMNNLIRRSTPSDQPYVIQYEGVIRIEFKIGIQNGFVRITKNMKWNIFLVFSLEHWLWVRKFQRNFK